MSVFHNLFVALSLAGFVLIPSFASAQTKSERALQLEVSSLHDKTQAYIDQGQLEKALRNAVLAHELSIEKLGSDSKITATLGLSLANLFAAVASKKDALVYYTKSLERFETLYGLEGIEVTSVLVYMSEWLTGDEQVDAVNRALAIHRKHRPDDLLSYAQIAARTGGFLSFGRGTRHEAVPVLKEALTILEAEHGRKSAELIPVLMSLGHAHASIERKYPARQKHYYQRALRIVRKTGDDKRRADLLLSAGVNLLELSNSDLSRPFIINAYKLHEKLYGVEDVRTAYAKLVWARYNLSEGGYERALVKLKQVFNVFRKNDEYRNFELMSLALIVEAHERLGERDQATPYCQAIGEVTPWTDHQNVKPVFKRMPYFYGTYRDESRFASIAIEFTVDKHGFVVTPEIVAENNSLPYFEKAVLEAVNSFRYAPRFVDGEPVDTPNVRVTFTQKPGKRSDGIYLELTE